VNVRGLIEGFYGPPWSHAERLDLMAFAARSGLTTWVHAPKDDPYHRAKWRDLYPDEELERLGELAAGAAAAGLELAWAVAPGLSVRYSDEAELEALAAKCEQVRSAGVSSIQLLWDDLLPELDAVDAERYAGEPSPIGAAQAEFTNRFRREVLGGAPLVVCPLEYHGVDRTPYRDTFAGALDRDVVLYWTGPFIVPPEIAREELDAAAEAFGHELLLWENYPVNDFEPEKLFLGPLRGRDPRLGEGPLLGLIANPMIGAVPSKLPLATVADFARDPAGYEPLPSFEHALAEHGAEVVEALRALAPEPAEIALPGDLQGLADAFAPGVDKATALALLQPFV
jgi:hypothetical protein